MALLKKIKSSTLIESLIATILILVIFMSASIIINNLYYNTFYEKENKIEDKLEFLEYRIINKKIDFPYEESIENWKIEAKLIEEKIIEIKTINLVTNKERNRILYLTQNESK